MSSNIWRFFSLSLTAGAIFAAALPGPALAQMSGSPAQVADLSAQVNNEGQVTVQVTPLSLSATAESWRFDVQMNTHVTPLDQDLLQSARLTDANGHEERPSAWQGDPPGGHHRKGVLVFKPIVPAPASVTLKIGGSDRCRSDSSPGRWLTLEPPR